MKKIIIFLLFLFTCFGSVKADSEYKLARENFNNVYYVQNGLPDFYGSDIQSKFIINNYIAYCVDPGFPIKNEYYSSIPLSNSKYDSNISNYLNLITYYGYDYPNHQTDKFYMATQALIWETISNYKIEFYTERYGYGEYINIDYEKNQIMNLISNHYKIPDFLNKTYTYNLTDKIIFNDEALNEFEIYDSNWQNVIIENNELKIEGLENFAGKINLKLRKKQYKDNKPQYLYNDNSQSIIIGGKLEPVLANLDINIETAEIKIKKIDSLSKKPISDVEFSLYCNEQILKEDGEIICNKGDIIRKSITDLEGEIIFDKLKFGKYYLKETKPVDGYTINRKIYEFDIDKNIIYTETIENELEYGSITVGKYGEVYNFKENKYEFKPLKGAKFMLYAKNDIITKDGTMHYKKGDIINYLFSNEQGLLEFNNLVLGEYCIEEVETVSGYLTDKKAYCYDLNEYYGLYVEVKNYLKKGNLKIYKLDLESNKVIKNSNVTFKIKNIETNNYIYINGSEYLQVNDQGFLLINNIPIGNYEIEEINVSGEYKINKNHQIIKIDDNIEFAEINFYNQLKKGNITIKKFDEESKKVLKNVEFSLYCSEDIISKDGNIHCRKDEKLITGYTNEQGIVNFENLVFGNYYIKETNNLFGYKENDNIYNILINEEKNYDIEISNELELGKISLIKYGEIFDYNNKNYLFKPLENIEFSLIATDDIKLGNNITYYKKNDLVAKKVTDKDGFIEFDNLKLGNYCLLESKTADEYIIDNNMYCFDLTKNKIQNIELKNYLKKDKIKIIKYDKENNLLLEGVEFSIYYNDILIDKYTTNKMGMIETEELPLNVYKIIESKALKNYVNNNTIIELNLYKENKLKITNEKIIDLPNTLSIDYILIISVIYFLLYGLYIGYEIKKKIF